MGAWKSCKELDSVGRKQRSGRWEASGGWIPCCGFEARIDYFPALCRCIGAVGPVGCRWVGMGGSGLASVQLDLWDIDGLESEAVASPVCRVEGKKGTVILLAIF